MSPPPSAPVEQRSTEQDNDAPDETTPLLLSRTKSQDPTSTESVVLPIEPEIKRSDGVESLQTKTWPRSTRWLILLCAFITSLTFSVTQAPILWVFRIMTCDSYYSHHPSEDPSAPDVSIAASAFGSFLLTTGNSQIEGDKCATPVIDASTALSIALLGASTTVFGVINLFLTSHLIKRIGLRYTLLIQLLFAAVRLFLQNVAIEFGQDAGILLFQFSQVVGIIGGPSGYILVINQYITEIVDHEARTAALGILQGNMLFGAASGFLIGGLVSDAFGIKAPFRLTFLLFLFAAIYAATLLPSITPQRSDKAQTKKKGKWRGCGRFFGPLAVFKPKKFLGKDNIVRIEIGALLVACGVFMGINASGYLPTLLQLYAMDEFGFSAKKNGSLIFMYSIMRGLFLTIVFPRVIKVGRRWTVRREAKARLANKEVEEQERLLSGQDNSNETSNQEQAKKNETFTFDLFYARFSLFLDGLFTLCCSFVHHGWQMYLMAAILPFSAGTGSAAKGTILQMVGSGATSDERTDALAGVSLIENIARLSTLLTFGAIFAAFAKIARLELVFVCNASFALVGFGILAFARFPLEGSRPLDKAQQEEDESSD